MPTESKRYFVLVISGVGERVSEGGEGLGLFSTQSKCFWLVVEEETTASNNWNGCNFKPFMGHTFVMFTKMNSFATQSPVPFIRKYGQ